MSAGGPPSNKDNVVLGKEHGSLELPLRRSRQLQARVSLVKAMVFPVVMYGCESWTVRKSDC